MKKTFSKEKLFDRTPRVFKRDATEVRFLLGGIGTGNFSVNSRGSSWTGKFLTGLPRIRNFPFPFLQFVRKTKNWKNLYRKFWNREWFRHIPAHTDIFRLN
mgnify:FL=1